MDRLFKTFSQVDASTTRQYGGSGLGLAICKKIVELMAGRIWVESVPGKGSTFCFEVTLGVGESPQGSVPLHSSVSGLGGKRLLLVEPNPTSRRILASYAASWGIVLRAAASPAEALQWVGYGEVFDGALVNMYLTGLDGLAFIRSMRDISQSAGFPVALMAPLGNIGALPPELAIAAVVNKPLKAVALRETLRAMLTGIQIERTARAASADDGMLGHDHPLDILLAEDNPTNQRMASLMLGRMGYKIEIANNGLEVLTALGRHSYNTILLDVQMPEMDGLTCAGEIIKRYPPELRPHMIAMTANAMTGDRENCLAAGMDDYVPKPVRPQDLKRALLAAHEKISSLHTAVPVLPVQLLPQAGCKSQPSVSATASFFSNVEAATPPPPPSETAAARQNSSYSIDTSVFDPHALEFIMPPEPAEALATASEMFESFFAESIARLADLQKAAAATDAAASGRLAHRMKGACSMIGFRELAEITAAIEKNARDGRPADSIVVGEVERALAAAKNCSQSWIEHLSERAKG
jgi:CheY-like chemotaxis protein